MGRLAADPLWPDGRIDRVVEMPVPQPSCPAFGGADLDVLYVSSAAIEMTPAFARAPDGGGLFTLDVGVRGLPVNASPGERHGVAGCCRRAGAWS